MNNQSQTKETGGLPMWPGRSAGGRPKQAPRLSPPAHGVHGPPSLSTSTLFASHTLPLIIMLATMAAVFCFGGEPEKTQIADRTTYLAEISTLLKVDWPKNRTVNIVCHGHSVPAGYFQTPVVDTFNAYPHLLHKGLKERFPNAVINVIVTAIGGETSESGAQRFSKDVLSHNPDVITMDYGLNDRGIGLDKARKSWSTMIELAQAKGIKIILLTPTADLNSQLGKPDDPLNQHAEQIRGLAKEYNVALVDSLAAFKAHLKNGGQLKDLMSSRNHPSRKGHDLVAEEILQWFPK